MLALCKAQGTGAWDTAGNKRSQPSCWQAGGHQLLTRLVCAERCTLSWTPKHKSRNHLSLHCPHSSPNRISLGAVTNALCPGWFLKLGNGWSAERHVENLAGTSRSGHKCPLSDLGDFRNLLGRDSVSHLLCRGAKLWPLSAFLLGPLRSPPFWSDLSWLKLYQGMAWRTSLLCEELKPQAQNLAWAKSKVCIGFGHRVRKRVLQWRVPLGSWSFLFGNGTLSLILNDLKSGI